jgi:hypothetical protein
MLIYYKTHLIENYIRTITIFLSLTFIKKSKNFVEIIKIIDALSFIDIFNFVYNNFNRVFSCLPKREKVKE